MRIITFAPYLISEKGHYYRYNQSLNAVADSLNLRFLSIIPKYSTLKIIPKNWLKRFSTSQSKIKKALKRFLIYSKIFRKKKRYPKAFFLESISEREYFLIFLSAILFLRKSDKLLLLLRFDLYLYSFNGFFVKKITSILSRLKKNIIFLTDSDLLKEQYIPYCYSSINLVPIPHTISSQNERSTSSLIRCWWPGEPRINKGLHQISGLIQSESQIKNEFEMLISEGDYKFKKTDLKLTFLPSILDNNDYVDTFYSIDIVLLPYHGMTYKRQTSGIFVEAVCYGAIPVTSPDTWMANELQKFDLTELILKWNEVDIWKILFEIKQSKIVEKKFQAMREEYKKFHSISSYEQILKLLL